MNFDDISKAKELLKNISNELTIMNMITILSNPELSKIFKEEERLKIEKYIKNNTLKYVGKNNLEKNSLRLYR